MDQRTQARPNFDGHWQPHLPGEFGYYDLTDPAIREAQAVLARAHGVDAFCYYHYWFGGQRLLERPFAEVLASGRPDFPFCVCWANENWTRRWDGLDHDVLMAQRYTPDDARRFAADLIPAFRDPSLRSGRRTAAAYSSTTSWTSRTSSASVAAVARRVRTGRCWRSVPVCGPAQCSPTTRPRSASMRRSSSRRSAMRPKTSPGDSGSPTRGSGAPSSATATWPRTTSCSRARRSDNSAARRRCGTTRLVGQDDAMTVDRIDSRGIWRLDGARVAPDAVAPRRRRASAVRQRVE